MRGVIVNDSTDFIMRRLKDVFEESLVHNDKKFIEDMLALLKLGFAFVSVDEKLSAEPNAETEGKVISAYCFKNSTTEYFNVAHHTLSGEQFQSFIMSGSERMTQWMIMRDTIYSSNNDVLKKLYNMLVNLYEDIYLKPNQTL